MKEKTIQEKVLKIKGLIWKHNTTPEAKAMAGTYARYGYEELVDEHNENIKKAISFAIKFRNTEVEKKVLDIIDNSGETDARTNMEIKKEIKDKLRKFLRGNRK